MPNYSLSSLFSTGGLYSTCSDLFKWNQALYTNVLLSDSSKNTLFNPVQNDYACGWFVKKGLDENGEYYERHFHGGWIKGYHAFILRRIPSQQVIILLDNSYSQAIQTIKNRIKTIHQSYLEYQCIKANSVSFLIICTFKPFSLHISSLN